jgi:hypothetical protein
MRKPDRGILRPGKTAPSSIFYNTRPRNNFKNNATIDIKT